MKRFTPPMAAATVAAMVWSVAPAAEPASTDTEGRLDAVEVSALPLGSDANLTPASFDLLEDNCCSSKAKPPWAIPWTACPACTPTPTAAAPAGR